jgi:transcriptional regulator with PAS, ATPase and Fis domain
VIALSKQPRFGTDAAINLSSPSPKLGEAAMAVAIQERLARTPSLHSWSELLVVVAEHNLPVLLTGETGVGKTWLARIIHDCSPRTNEPFVTVPCGALPPQLIESEFFGHTRGAFTGADRSRAGKIAAAGKGSLLLDEIDLLSLQQQGKLLRVLDSGEYEQLGSNETKRRACRIIAASNADLDELVKCGAFRSDLYYRLHVLPLHLPPLRERIDDISPLAKGLASRYAAQFGKALHEIDREALALLKSYSWPGNLRELDSAMRQAVLLSRGEVLLCQHLPENVRRTRVVGNPRPQSADESLRSAREAAERGLVRRVLAAEGHRRDRTAEKLGISRTTLHKKMKKYGLTPA